MTKNEPLQFVRTICQVLGIGLFSFLLCFNTCQAETILADQIYGAHIRYSRSAGDWAIRRYCDKAGFCSAEIANFENNDGTIDIDNSFSLPYGETWGLMEFNLPSNYTYTAGTVFVKGIGSAPYSGNWSNVGPVLVLSDIDDGGTPVIGDMFSCGNDATSNALASNFIADEAWNDTGWNALTLTPAAISLINEHNAVIAFCFVDNGSDYNGYTTNLAGKTGNPYYYAGGTGENTTYISVEGTKDDGDDDELVNFYTGDCCAGQECIVPIDFPRGLDEATLYTNLDAEYCTGWHTEEDTVYTLDFFNKTPEYILLEAANEGVHWLCAWTAGGEADPALYHIPINYYNATNSPYCILSTPMEDHDFCSDEELQCGDFQISTSTWDSIFCGLKQAGCWFIVPASTSLNYIGDRANLLKSKFPFNLYFDVLDNIETGFATTTDSRAGSIGVPMYSASSSDFYFITVLDASSTEKAIGKANATLFRKTQGWIIWGAVAFYLLLRLRPKQEV